MKLRILVSMAGADFTLSPGDVTERFPNDEAIRLIDAAYAVPADGTRDIERAIVVDLKTETRKKARG